MAYFELGGQKRKQPKLLVSYPSAFEFKNSSGGNFGGLGCQSLIAIFQSSPCDKNENIDKRKLVETFDVREQDILCGRGVGSKVNAGNVMFRSLVRDCQQTYLSSKPFEKTNIAKEIVFKVKEDGGRFLKKHAGPGKTTHRWYVMDDKEAREKTCQALRERVPNCLLGMNTKSIKNNICKDNLNSGGAMISIKDQDVLFGRGGLTNAHYGNKNYRSLVRESQHEYMKAPKLKKAEISLRIVDQVYNEGGRFLIKNEKGHWVEVSKERARKKTSQTMREKNHHN